MDNILKSIKINQKINTWFSGNPDGLSTIIEIKPIKYGWIVKASAPCTRRGWMEMTVFKSVALEQKYFSGER